MSTNPTPVPSPARSSEEEPALRVEGLNAWYGRAQALFDVSMDCRNGEIVGLIGRNGAGKTTTILSIMGAGLRAHGAMNYFGKRIDAMATDRRARAGIAWVPDNRRVFHGLTVQENIELGATAARGRDRLSVSDVVDLIPMIGALLEKDGRALSGGQQQAVAIARALVSRPRVLLLDEPMEGLAPVVVAELEQAIAALPDKTGATVLIAEQSLELVLRLSRRIFVLENGRVVHSSDADTFAGQTELHHRYLSVSDRGATD
jgi:ABC-type branched-subunit amino acid transport system ATPase component